MELPRRVRDAAERYLPVEAGGLTLWPVRVKEYGEFAFARMALEAVQQSFPAKYLTMPALQAFFQIDVDAVQGGGKPTGLFAGAVMSLILALRVGEGMEAEERLKLAKIGQEVRDERLTLVRLAFPVGEETVTVTPAQYRKLRAVIAAQNGVELVGETANPELVEAEREAAALGAPAMEGGVREEITFVAARERREEEEIEEWAILKLQNHARAHKQAIDYAVCGVNEGAGAKWRGGNPVPHPYLRRKRTLAGVRDLSEFAGGAGERAVRNAAPSV